MTQPTVYLASGSPRRREILTNLGFHIIKINAEIDETPRPNESASDYVLRMAIEKNRAAHRLNPTLQPNLPLISADTTVALNGSILGKPESPEHARQMLQALSGSVHQVLTAVCISRHGSEHSHTQSSDVHFKTLSPAEIQAYLDSGEPTDKAGAYGIQGIGGAFVSHLSGSFTGVMGLPVYETLALLQQSGCPTPLST